VTLEPRHDFAMGLRGYMGERQKSPYGTSPTHSMNFQNRATLKLERYSNFPKKCGSILRHDTQS